MGQGSIEDQGVPTALIAVAFADAHGIYAVPSRCGTQIYWRPRLPNGCDPDLGWLLDSQPTRAGWLSWADAVIALGSHLTADPAL